MDPELNLPLTDDRLSFEEIAYGPLRLQLVRDLPEHAYSRFSELPHLLDEAARGTKLLFSMRWEGSADLIGILAVPRPQTCIRWGADFHFVDGKKGCDVGLEMGFSMEASLAVLARIRRWCKARE
jgi:hypothetical protein